MTVQAYDYRYGDLDWRSEIAETFRMVKDVKTLYSSTFGTLTGTKETRTEWADAMAVAPADPLTSPPYFFADSTWRRDPAYTFQAVLVTTVTYQQTGPDSYQQITVTLDLLTGETSTDVQTFSGIPPRVQTVNTALTSLVVQPTFGTLEDDCLDEFVESKKSLTLKWAETDQEFSNSIRRQMQRDSAIVRSWTMAANPLIKIGHTVRVIHPKRSIDALHIVTARTITRNSETGDCSMKLTVEYWVR